MTPSASVRVLAQLRDRWQSSDGVKAAHEVRTRLRAGKSVRKMGLGEHDGRVDLRGLAWSDEVKTSSTMFGRWQVDQMVGLPEFRNVELEGLDLSGSQLEHLRVFTSVIRDCRFDRARLRDARMWAVEIEDTSFASADLRDSSLGATLKGRWNTFRRARFVDADLRGLTTPEATFDRCDFGGARLQRTSN